MSTTTSTINVTAQKATVAALLAALVKGIDTDLAGVDPFLLDGTLHARAQLLARFQAALDAFVSVKSARTALLQAVANQKAALAQTRPLRAGMKRFLQIQFGPSSPKLQDFGFTPARIPSTPVKTKAEAKVKSAATRAARGTKGKKQRANIRGNVSAAPSQGGVTVKAPPAPTTAS
ncbi:MAG TPA: hypothetical protein VGY54_12120 [Polyangiaceae bacterium]|nr:hypothetical protein [Polyangiaceae bacterium]